MLTNRLAVLEILLNRAIRINKPLVLRRLLPEWINNATQTIFIMACCLPIRGGGIRTQHWNLGYFFSCIILFALWYGMKRRWRCPWHHDQFLWCGELLHSQSWLILHHWSLLIMFIGWMTIQPDWNGKVYSCILLFLFLGYTLVNKHVANRWICCGW